MENSLVGGEKPRTSKFDIDLAEVRTAEGKLYLFVAIDRTSKFAVVELVEMADMQAAAVFLHALVKAVSPIASIPSSPTTASSSRPRSSA